MFVFVVFDLVFRY